MPQKEGPRFSFTAWLLTGSEVECEALAYMAFEPVGTNNLCEVDLYLVSQGQKNEGDAQQV